MSTTYTTNYHLGKQTDTSDNFDMSVITDNMDIIDTQMKSNETNILSIQGDVSLLGTLNSIAYNGNTYGVSKYTGDLLDLSDRVYLPSIYVRFNIESSNSIQGGAVYGDYYIQFTDKMASFTIINLKSKSVVQDTTLSPVATYHCNNANFSDTFYVNTDVFPLLYISQENATEHKVLVYRLVGAIGEISLQLIQTITFDEPSVNEVYYPNAFVDTDSNQLVQMGYTTNSYEKSDSNRIVINVFNLPDISSSAVDLHDTDKMSTFTLPSLEATQGGFIKHGKIYQVYGISGERWINVIDIAQQRIVTSIDLNKQAVITGEQETVFAWNDKLYTVGINKHIYEISTSGDNYKSVKKVLYNPAVFCGFSGTASNNGALVYHHPQEARATILTQKNDIIPIFEIPIGNYERMENYQYVDDASWTIMHNYGLIMIPSGTQRIKLSMSNSSYYYGLVTVRRLKTDKTTGEMQYDSGWTLGGTDIDIDVSNYDYNTYEYGLISTFKKGSAGTAAFTFETITTLGWTYQFT